MARRCLKRQRMEIARYLDRVSRETSLTSKRISHCAGEEVIPIALVRRVMGELIEEGKWEKIKSWSMDGDSSYARVIKPKEE